MELDEDAVEFVCQTKPLKHRLRAGKILVNICRTQGHAADAFEFTQGLGVQPTSRGVTRSRYALYGTYRCDDCLYNVTVHLGTSR
jgi:hypothetical protein